MRIDDVQVGCVELPMRTPMSSAVGSYRSTHNVVVEVRSGELSGEGVALTFSENQAAAVASLVRDLSPLVLGTNGSRVRPLWNQMMQAISLAGRSGLGMSAVAALDTALWDLLARSLDRPLFEVLGGSADSLPVYAQPGWLSSSVEEVIDEASLLHSTGFGFYKMRVGSPDWRADVRRVQRVREAIPAGMGLLVDANQGWSRLDAMVAGPALDELELVWIEEPISALDVAGTGQLAQRLRTPLAMGENAFGSRDVAAIIEHRAAAIVMLDLQHCGGPTGWLDAATMVQQHGLAVSNHLFTEVSVHLLAAVHRPLIVEFMPGWWDELYDEPLAFPAGRIAPSSGAGIGRRFSSKVRNALRPL
jgi:mandelate racemase